MNVEYGFHDHILHGYGFIDKTNDEFKQEDVKVKYRALMYDVLP